MDILVHTLVLRPYVFAFLLAYLVVAIRDLGPWRTAHFTVWVFAAAWSAEYVSTRVGVPFGLYHYTGTTRQLELFISNVPFFDSLSFVFLAYAAYCLARFVLNRSDGLAVAALAGVLMMLLDVVIDPLAVRGGRWFLGHIFYYVEDGEYFGVPVSNFAGWLLVGWAAVGGFLAAGRVRTTASPLGGVTLYYSVLAFNLVITWWIGEILLLVLGASLHLVTFTVLTAWRTVVSARAAEQMAPRVPGFPGNGSRLFEEGA